VTFSVFKLGAQWTQTRKLLAMPAGTHGGLEKEREGQGAKEAYRMKIASVDKHNDC